MVAGTQPQGASPWPPAPSPPPLEEDLASLQLLKTVTFTVISIMTHSNGLNKLTLNSETFTIKFLWNKIPSCKFYSNIPELGNQVHIPNSKHGAEELMVRPQKASPFHSVRFHAKTA